MDLPASLEAYPVEPLQLPDVRRLERMPSLPAWVASRIASLKTELQPDPTTGKRRNVPTLPADMTLKAAERNELVRHLADLRALIEQTPMNNTQAENDTLVALTKLMMVLPSMTQNELSAEARGEAFMVALEDMPVWATMAAIRCWYRGDCGTKPDGKPYDYHWCPAPAELRAVAKRELHRITDRAHHIERLLRAETLIEFSDEHCTRMRARLADVFRGLATPPVGKDGSGGAVSEG